MNIIPAGRCRPAFRDFELHLTGAIQKATVAVVRPVGFLPVSHAEGTGRQSDDPE
jgi:hypothetical protein